MKSLFKYIVESAANINTDDITGEDLDLIQRRFQNKKLTRDYKDITKIIKKGKSGGSGGGSGEIPVVDREFEELEVQDGSQPPSKEKEENKDKNNPGSSGSSGTKMVEVPKDNRNNEQGATQQDIDNQLKKNTNKSTLSPEQRKKIYDEMIKRVEKQIVEDPNITKEYWEQQIKEGQNVQTTGGRGEGSGDNGSLVDVVLRRMKTSVNWRKALHDFVTVYKQHYFDWRKPSKRSYSTGAYMPRSQKLKTVDKFIVAIDTSGSCMSSETYSYFVTEVVSLFESLKDIKAQVVFWSDSISPNGIIDLTSSNYRKLLNVKPTSGGTRLSCVGDYLEVINYVPSGIAVFTDGEVEENPNLPKTIKGKVVPYIFFIIPGGKTDIVSKFGKTYKVLEG